MTTAIVTTNGADIIESVMLAGDLMKLSAPQRVSYYKATCESLHLNPLTKPFEFITLNGKLVMYATRNCTDQLRKIHGISIRIVSRERLEDIYVVTAQASLPDGRMDESIGAVNIAGLKGEALANALMKSETKAKRRATLCIVGLSFSDETEVDSIPNAQRIHVNTETGEVLEVPTPEPPTIPTPTMRTPDAPATDKQLGMLANLRDELGWTKAQAVAFMRDKGMDLTVLTKGQASTLIEAFQNEIRLQKLEATPPTQPSLSDEYDEIERTEKRNGALAGVTK